MWGKSGLEEICKALPVAVCERTAGLSPMPDWLPLDDLIAWHMTVWNGPAARDVAVMTRHARLTVDQGFGRVKKFVIGAMSPEFLTTRVVSLWDDEYTTGRLQASSATPHVIELALSDHAYVEIPLMRLIISEAFRHILSMTRARNVTVVHARRDASLVVTLRWE
jgi:hypothetical protein